MVEFSSTQLDLAFAALADPTRRAIVDRLADEPELSVTEIAAPFQVSLPAVMKHLDVLGAAGLITRSKKGRTVTVRLAPEPMKEAMDWLRRYERFWSARLDRLAAYAEAEEAKAGATP
jgi:DNA-binding transcriptional ArsR family regulator